VRCDEAIIIAFAALIYCYQKVIITNTTNSRQRKMLKDISGDKQAEVMTMCDVKHGTVCIKFNV